MNNVRAFTLIASLALHGGLAAYAAYMPSQADRTVSAFDAGTGNDQFVVEQGVGIDGIVKLGDSVETIRAAEVTPVEQAPPPPPPEAKPVDELQDTIVSKSVTAVEDNIVKLDEPPPEVKPEEVKPMEVRPVEVTEPPVTVAIAKDASSGTVKTGGDATALAEYRGKLAKLFQECKFAPKKRVSGNAQVRIVVDESGKMVSREIAKSSGDPDVDKAALANVDYAIKDCKEEGLPQAPEGLTDHDRTVLQGYSFK